MAGLPNGNRLIAIAPADASIAGSVFVGSEPDALAISPDATVAYVALEGAAAVRAVDIASMNAGIQFTLGPTMGFGPSFATRIAVMPGSPGTVVVSRHDIGSSPDYQGVAVFDNGAIRANAINTFYGPTALAFGVQASTIYGHDNYGPSALYRMSIDPSGISVASSSSNAIPRSDDISVDNGLIYSSSGAVVDAATMNLVGTYQSSGPFVVDDSTLSVAFASGHAVHVFDRDSFLPMFSISIPAGGAPIKASGCGPACMAVIFDSGQIFVLPNVTEDIFADGFE